MPRIPYRSAPLPLPGMPPGIPYIIGNEAAERFSFYGMRTILVIFMVKYLHLMGEVPGEALSDAAASEKFHRFVADVYFYPILGALLADIFLGKYRVIILLSVVYCLGHGLLALMGWAGNAETLLYWGLMCIAVGSGGIKPCVSAHVGDQFGGTNRHLLTRVFNWFYFSINLGAFVSTLLTPWLLHWHGPHWAFGVPGALMAVATLLFWMGRRKFIHVPAQGAGFLRDLFTWQGISALGRLMVIYLFVAVFWALFDQTGSSWVLQAQDMDLRWLGVEWLPSQVQAINPVMILVFIPLFTYLVYPAMDRVFPLTPLRKISIGLFVMVAGFGLVALVQEWIDAGQRPSIAWQILAYGLVTAAEVMVSIVCLEFSYTQAPRSMKSVVMALFLWSVSLGNLFTAGVNRVIQVPSPAADLDSRARAIPGQREWSAPGPDGEDGTADDISAAYDENGARISLSYPAKSTVDQAAAAIQAWAMDNEGRLPATAEGQVLLEGIADPWGRPLRYTQRSSQQCRVLSLGPDGEPLTEWDQGAILTLSLAGEGEEAAAGWFTAFTPDQPWLETRQEALRLARDPGPEEPVAEAGGISLERADFVGGQAKLEGAAYFWFFTRVMLGTAALFVGVALVYRPREHFHDEIPVEEEIAEALR